MLRACDLWSVSTDFTTEALFLSGFLSTTLTSLLYVGLVVLNRDEHFHSLRASSTISVYLALTAFSDALTLQRLAIEAPQQTLHQNAILLLLKLTLIFLQEMPKRFIEELEVDGTLRNENTAGFFSRTLVLWVSSTLILGFRQNLTLDQLPNLGPEFSSGVIFATFDRVWSRFDQTSRHALARACAHALFWTICIAAIPRLILTAFSFTIPSLVGLTLEHLHQDIDRQTPTQLILMTSFIFTSKAISAAAHGQIVNRMTTLLRAMLMTKISEKTINLRDAPASKATILTLINAEMENILETALQLHSYWLSTLELAVGVYLLSGIVESAAYLAIVPLAILCGIVWKLTRRLGRDTILWNEAIEARISQTGTMLSQITGIKMMGVENQVKTLIQNLRLDEISVSKAARKSIVYMVASYPLDFWFAPLMIVIGGMKYTVWKDGIEPLTLFPVLAYFEVTSDAVVALFRFIPQMEILLASFGRIQDFLLLPERTDPRELRDFTRLNNAIIDSADDNESAAEAAMKNRCISVMGVSVATREGDANVLNNLHFSVARRTLTMVTGPVGSGKSVLLKTLLGETTLSEGRIQIAETEWAYCDQRIWLPDVSVKEAILGEAPFNREKYDETITACALGPDIERLSNGADTKVGTNGVKLSGGQRQRIALARAVYSDCRVLICDDVISALDARTASSVFTAVFSSDGLLKKQGRTAVLATHSIEWLSQADQVIHIDIAGQATVYSDQEEIALFAEQAMELLPPPLNSADTGDNSISHHSQSVEQEKEEMNGPRRYTDFSLYLLLFQTIAGNCCALFLISIAAVACTERFPSLYMRIWVDVDPSNFDYVYAMMVFGAVSMVLNTFGSWFYQFQIIPKISANLHNVFLEKVMSATLPFLTSTNNGILLNRFSQDMTLLGQTVPMRVYQFVYSLFFAASNIGFIAAGTSYTIFLAPIMLAILFTIQYFYLQTSRQIRVLDLEARTPLYAKLSEVASGSEHIRSFGWQATTMDKTFALLDYSQKPCYYMYSIRRWLLLVLMLCSVLIACFVVGTAVMWAETTSSPRLGLALMGIIHYSFSAEVLVVRWAALETSLGSVHRLQTFLQQTPTEEANKREVDPPWQWPRTGKVEIKKMCARYSSDPKSPMVLEDINLLIPHGETAVIVGRTGSGKSSLILAMLNFLDITGSIFVDGVDITTIPKARLRRTITTIPQDSVEMFSSIRENIFPFVVKNETKAGRITDDAINYALRTVDLEDHVARCGGLDAQAADMNFSAGQRQLFSIARAMLHKIVTGSKLVLMDEVTSNMDYETDRRVQAAMTKIFRGCTRIVISHRSTGLRGCHQVISLRSGLIVSKERRNVDAESDSSDAWTDESPPVSAEQGTINTSSSSSSQLSLSFEILEQSNHSELQAELPAADIPITEEEETKLREALRAVIDAPQLRGGSPAADSRVTQPEKATTVNVLGTTAKHARGDSTPDTVIFAPLEDLGSEPEAGNVKEQSPSVSSISESDGTKPINPNCSASKANIEWDIIIGVHQDVETQDGWRKIKTPLGSPSLSAGTESVEPHRTDTPYSPHEQAVAARLKQAEDAALAKAAAEERLLKKAEARCAAEIANSKARARARMEAYEKNLHSFTMDPDEKVQPPAPVKPRKQQRRVRFQAENSGRIPAGDAKAEVSKPPRRPKPSSSNDPPRQFMFPNFITDQHTVAKAVDSPSYWIPSDSSNSGSSLGSSVCSGSSDGIPLPTIKQARSLRREIAESLQGFPRGVDKVEYLAEQVRDGTVVAGPGYNTVYKVWSRKVWDRREKRDAEKRVRKHRAAKDAQKKARRAEKEAMDIADAAAQEEKRGRRAKQAATPGY